MSAIPVEFMYVTSSKSSITALPSPAYLYATPSASRGRPVDVADELDQRPAVLRVNVCVKTIAACTVPSLQPQDELDRVVGRPLDDAISSTMF